ncbi:MAG: PIN domain-containing protein [Dehalococcoidia bacterium]|nr:PIN domain-containing protein [Dehalococcoidia bacterium]
MSVSDRLVLVDTSIWISYFRGEEEVHKKVNELIDSGMVRCLKLIIAELIQGAKTEEGVNVMKDLADVFPLLAEGPESWENAGILSFQLRKAGKNIGLSDCYIATVAKENDAMIYTLDRHFVEIQRHFDITLL